MDRIKTKFPKIKRDYLDTLQINIGYKCNQSCSHCHVNAGPNRTEMMSSDIIKLIPKVIKANNIKMLDITGGAPELHPKFKQLVKEVRSLNVEVMDRCNLTILTEPGHENLASFLASNKVQITASLPCYLQGNVDKQRGKGVFEKSIFALKQLNSYGYGIKNKGLILNLVYNPSGPELPPSQKELEDIYRHELKERHGIYFSNLFVLANMPINRYEKYLNVIGKLKEYKKLLNDNHNSRNLNSVMCKTTLSVDWKGHLYDCDFNQQLGIRKKGNIKHLDDLLIPLVSLKNNPIAIGDHCFGCTAGAGSSCGGELT
ncbi:arsenosugar biosynthesis radical SAM (seleno)protein ArsS [Prochlorococcus marinus]|uniref:Radical SAM protein n=1 Tax=Prochlorococcus marinus XMU1408 TaxID=2213228 RepID=A0A318R3R1_PROMR|nr:arsenosugar biosynthesis radical SAM (seleno)protein ArsS [Prochlorococcus marinus]MBW3041667.1 radical SAM protein [Prochlorococcus marinus str. XMU1408]PYE02820.1 radical SAM protein [Prochlorococcus marinus XMU1408]